MEGSAWKHDEETHWRSELNEIRKQIDEIDLVVAALLEQRLELARRAGAVKDQHELPVKDSGREQEVLRRVSAVSQDPELAEAIRAIYRKVIAEAKKIQAADVLAMRRIS